jgi:predicted nucleic acid-binding Zn ribbon protein
MTLATMLDWYAPDTDTHEVACPDCGRVVVTSTKIKSARCRECADEANRRKSRERNRLIYRMGDESVDLAYAVIRNAAEDARRGDRDAAQFLVAHDGAELWLRALGIGITRAMRARLITMAMGGEG